MSLKQHVVNLFPVDRSTSSCVASLSSFVCTLIWIIEFSFRILVPVILMLISFSNWKFVMVLLSV